MAEQAMAPDDAEPQAQSGGILKMLALGVAMFVIVLAAQTVAPLIADKLGLAPAVAPQPSATPAATETAEDDATAGPPIYWPLKPAMVVNFASSGEAGFLQVEMEVMAHRQAVIDQVKEHMPALRNALLLLLASQTEETVFTTEGKQALRRQALAAINAELAPYTDGAGVDAVYFTSFVAQ